jgi:hypothetical protein
MITSRITGKLIDDYTVIPAKDDPLKDATVE